MGYRGKVVEQARARELRARSWTLQEIADELGVAKGSVSVWVRDVEFTPKPRQPGAHRRPHPWIARKEAEIAELLEEGRVRQRQLRLLSLPPKGHGAGRSAAIVRSPSGVAQ